MSAVLAVVQAEREFRTATQHLLDSYGFVVTDDFMDRLLIEMEENKTTDRVIILQNICAEFGLHITTRFDKGKESK